jgi:Zn-dependent membrane protease YugP
VAYANDCPVLIFSDSIYQRGSAKDVADTAIHEIGHALNLNHLPRMTAVEIMLNIIQVTMIGLLTWEILLARL